MIREATEDRLHQDYRSPLFPEAPQLLARLVGGGGAGVVLVGGGAHPARDLRRRPRRRGPVEGRGGHGGDRRAGPGPAAAQRPRGPHRRGVRPVTRTFHIRTFGCQMNEHDSERLAGLLVADGLEPTDDIEAGRRRASSTPAASGRTPTTSSTATSVSSRRCASSRPGMQIAVGGCLAQKDREHGPATGRPRRRGVRHPQPDRAPRRCCAGPRREGPVVEILDAPDPEGAAGPPRWRCSAPCASSPTRPGSPSRWGATTRAPSASCPRCAGPR